MEDGSVEVDEYRAEAEELSNARAKFDLNPVVLPSLVLPLLDFAKRQQGQLPYRLLNTASFSEELFRLGKPGSVEVRWLLRR